MRGRAAVLVPCHAARTADCPCEYVSQPQPGVCPPPPPRTQLPGFFLLSFLYPYPVRQARTGFPPMASPFFFGKRVGRFDPFERRDKACLFFVCGGGGDTTRRGKQHMQQSKGAATNLQRRLRRHLAAIASAEDGEVSVPGAGAGGRGAEAAAGLALVTAGRASSSVTPPSVVTARRSTLSRCEGGVRRESAGAARVSEWAPMPSASAVGCRVRSPTSSAVMLRPAALLRASSFGGMGPRRNRLRRASISSLDGNVCVVAVVADVAAGRRPL